MIGCGETERNRAAGGEVEAPTEPATAPEAPFGGAGGGEAGVVLFLGTSLTAGLGLPTNDAYPAVIQRMIEEEGLPFRAINAGVSGETSAGALRRVEWLLRQPFDVLVLETGANDMLRGADPAATERNIGMIVERIREERPDARIILAGMLAMPNLGAEYARRFDPIYPRLAGRHEITIIPFLLEGVAGERNLNQADGVHPNAEGQRIVAETVWKTLGPLLRLEATGMAGG